MKVCENGGRILFFLTGLKICMHFVTSYLVHAQVLCEARHLEVCGISRTVADPEKRQIVLRNASH